MELPLPFPLEFPLIFCGGGCGYFLELRYHKVKHVTTLNK